MGRASRVALHLWALSIGLGLLWPPPAWGQETTGGGARHASHARALFEEGTALLERGDYAPAIDRLRRSLALAPRASTRLNLGLALHQGGASAEAAEMLWAWLAETDSSEESERRTRIRAIVDGLAAELASFEVEAHPDGASVSLDGSALPEAPRHFVQPGERRLRVEASGHLPDEQPLVLEAGRHTVVTVELRPDSGAPSPVDLTPWAVATTAVGVVVAGVGVGLGFVADATWEDAQQRCPDLRCPSEEDRDVAERAGTQADWSTALLITGAVVGLASIPLYLLDDAGSEAAVEVGFGRVGLRWAL